MKSFLRAVCVIAMLLGGIAAAISIIGLFAGSRDEMPSMGAVLGASIGVFIFAGILWVLLELSQQLRELPKEFREERARAEVPPQPGRLVS